MATKPNTHKRKFEIKKVEQKIKERMTFPKHEVGLFNKVTKLSILCEAEIALIINSEKNGNLHACGYPSTDTVIQRFVAGRYSDPNRYVRDDERKKQQALESLILQYEASEAQLEERKMHLQEMSQIMTDSFFNFWWENSIEEMSLGDLENFKASLENLKLNLVAVGQEKKFNSLRPQPLSIVSSLTDIKS
ncbi:agamous-like MADS-box protein AGL62 [Gastrolobium bilobum]|uniref:agamous-like MADS-box protein AGL62 n=1 Tax=Gastrolobium bilobum TaxID=150636 RepID=UPI002AB062F5|nr:agamous-like MADS-box protein AGL62 [Gastrolobium bilobum]